MSTRDELVMSDGVVMGIDTSESRTDTSESRADTGESRTDALCGHKGGVVEILGGRFKCTGCGRVFIDDPNAAPKEDPDPPNCLHEGCVFILSADVIRETGMRFECSRCGERFTDNPNLFEKRNCLKEADKVINGERQDSYGAPEDSFTIIAGYWNVFLAAKLRTLGVDVKDLLTPLDTTNMMVLFKQARKLGQKPSRDNYVDSCGYEAIGADRLSE